MGIHKAKLFLFKLVVEEAILFKEFLPHVAVVGIRREAPLLFASGFSQGTVERRELLTQLFCVVRVGIGGGSQVGW